MIIVAPHDISLLVMLAYNISKHLIRPLVCIKLRLETAGGCKAVFLGKPEIMEKRPQDVVAVTIVILMNNLFIKEYRYAPLQSINKTFKSKNTCSVYVTAPRDKQKREIKI